MTNRNRTSGVRIGMRDDQQHAEITDRLAVLSGGGEMGERTRSFDWSKTPVGPIADWPQALKTVVRVMLDSRYAMWLGWGPEFTFFYNDAYARMTLGPKHPWALGRFAREVWPEIWADVGPRAESVIRTGNATWDEGLLLFLERRGFKEETYHTFSYSPVPDDDGGVGGMLCVVTEDTERTIGERRLRTLRELAARTTDQTRSVEHACRTAAQILAGNTRDVPFALLYLLDVDGRRAVLVAATGVEAGSPISPAFVEFTGDDCPWPFRAVAESSEPLLVSGLPAELGTLPGGAWPEPSQQAVVLPMAQPGQTRLGGFIVAGVSRHRPFDDGYRGFLELLAGQVASAVAGARAYEEEKCRAEALAELDRAKTAFFSNVSHEFRTPLTLMLGPVEDLLACSRTDLTPAAASQLELVRRNGLRLLRLVNTLLDFSRIEAGRVRAFFQPTDLASLTADVASNFRSACERAGLRLFVDCPPLLEPVYIDRDMWEKIVLNLLSNAFKFTFEGEIAVTVRQTGTSARLTVRDTGTGISAEELPRVFERFHRTENALGRTHEGSGIGLALVQELVKLHGGSIHAESVVGQGTTFAIDLRAGKSHLPPELITDNRPLPITEVGAGPYVEEALRWLPGERVEVETSRYELPAVHDTAADSYRRSETVARDRPRVLVADDNADVRQYVSRLLSDHYEVEALPDGESALAAALEHPPDLILTDVMMPKLDGFGLMKAVRANSRTSGVPVIMLSARAGEESRVEGLEAGADDYLVKPFSAKELLARVGAHTDRKRAAEALKDANRRKDEFLATLAHELRNPLAPLRNGLQIIRMSIDDRAAVEQARAMMERQLGQMVHLVDDLLDLSRISLGVIVLRRERVEVGKVVQQAVETSRPLMEASAHELTIEFPPETIFVDADTTRLAQVISNLLNNAAKYTEPGGRITLKVERRGNEAVVSVRDTGVGIPAHMLPKVFDIFTQVDRSLERSQGGLGIGLSLVKGLVEQHGGSVEASSDGNGAGSEFVIRLPVALAVAKERNASADDCSRSNARRRILVVDDNRDAAMSLAIMLKLMGNETKTAYDGLEALDVAAAFRPDMVMLDIGMPKLNGFDTAQRMRQHTWGKHTVLVALTGWGQEEDKRRSLEAGFNFHMVKPVDLAAIEKLLAGLQSNAG